MACENVSYSDRAPGNSAPAQAERPASGVHEKETIETWERDHLCRGKEWRASPVALLKRALSLDGCNTLEDALDVLVCDLTMLTAAIEYSSAEDEPFSPEVVVASLTGVCNRLSALKAAVAQEVVS